MGKASAPPPPDNSAVAASSAHAADLQFQLGEEQLAFGKQQYADTAPYTQEYLKQQTAASATETENAHQAQEYYNTTYKPIETQLALDSSNYNSAANSRQRAGAAQADVASQYDSARAASLSSLESFGVDPSQTRYGALDLGTRISQAAATSAAGTQSYNNSEATGLALEGNAVNVGRGYPGSVAQDYSTAQGAGSAGILSANQTTNTAVNSMGTPSSYFTNANTALQNQAAATNSGFTNQVTAANINNQNSATTSAGIGSAVGLAASVAIAV